MGAIISSQWTLYAIPALVCYVFVCRSLRFRQRDEMQKKYGFHTRESLSKMTLTEAWEIQKWLGEQEFPKIISTSLFFALFKTYAIPSISSLLIATGQLSSPTTMTKRQADTSVLLTNMVIGAPGSKRALEAVARTNYLHDKYRRSGKISNDDMLYTLSLFALEAVRWTNKYEWRTLTDMERCAIATYWKSLGEDMEISFERLPSCQKGWRDGLEWLDELDQWSVSYEKEHMVPADSNARLASSTLDVLVYKLPVWAKPFGRNVAAALMGPRLCAAMKIPFPSPRFTSTLAHLINLRKHVLLSLSLPRRPSKRRIYIFDNPSCPISSHPSSSSPTTTQPRYNVPRWRIHPWYVAPSTKNRWGVGAWLTWWRGGVLPGDEGEKYEPGGFSEYAAAAVNDRSTPSNTAALAGVLLMW
ncbi:hypothetical protein K490DRAFT_54148 [Saccharata proteae CBS 121410]|uniref:ER-bound oxygenase mpaB/mpaB'/Rubber oxygenase catalytic domain-containing protein n=1 Tax=Saccharata proteae CBS 121410 TaxID=1314787 RepID=A0A9P4LZM5_9PEZI|nr:hypothetical protein K490DRAFT_54148 [Saccharata proteae CBS 121410]